MDYRSSSFGFIQARQDSHFLAGEFFAWLIDFVVDGECVREGFHRGKVRIFDDHRGVENSPGMFIEPGADHFAVLGPFVERIQSAVDSYEAFAVVVHEGEQRGFLFVV